MEFWSCMQITTVQIAAQNLLFLLELLQRSYQLVRQRLYVHRYVCFVNIQSPLHENVCARIGNAAYIIFIMWNSISGLEAWYHFRFNISCGVTVTVSHQKKIR